MATKREQILAAIKTTLAGTTGVASRIYRSRVTATSRAQSPSIVIEPVSDVPRDILHNQLDWTLTIRIVVVVRATVPDKSGDNTVNSLHSKLSADPTLGGLCIDLAPRTTTFETFDADKPAGLIICQYAIDYRTDRNNLSA